MKVKSPTQGSRRSSEEFDESEEDFSEITGSDPEEEITWVEWFCNLKGNEYFVEVEEDYIQDDFNLTGLSSQVQFFESALNVILDIDEQISEELQPVVESCAQVLYGLIHARYILTSRGMTAMLDKYKLCTYGHCPNVSCENQAVLATGISDTVLHSAAKVFCPRCQELYMPKSPRLGGLDGAYFGSTFAHLFFFTFSEQCPPSKQSEFYVPRVYGFRVSPTVKDILRKQREEKGRGSPKTGGASAECLEA